MDEEAQGQPFGLYDRRSGMRKSFTIPGKILSLNRLFSLHWSKRSKHNKEWFRKVVAIAGIYKGLPLRAVLSLRVHLNRRLDTDNMIGGCKALKDAIVSAGWMRDDSDKWCEVVYFQVKCPKGQERVDVYVQDEVFNEQDARRETELFDSRNFSETN